MRACLQGRSPAPRRAQLSRRLALTATLAVLTSGAGAHPTHPGKWTGTMTWGSTAINMVLLPGDASYHGKVLWWNHDDLGPVAGGIWGWNPPADGPVNGGTFPVSSFVDLHLDDPLLHSGQPNNIFCAGQTMLEDGRLLVTGGTALGEGGTRSVALFSPNADANGVWSAADSMHFRRWYSDNTLLPDGRVVTVTGSSYSHYAVVGGLVDASADTATRILQRLGVSFDKAWEDNVVPTSPVSPNLPLDPVSDASTAEITNSSLFLFGGKDAGGSITNKAIQIQRDRNVDAADYWFKQTALIQTGGANGVPAPRVGAAVASFHDGTEVLILGGVGSLGLLNEIWRGTIGNGIITWRKLTNQTSEPLPALHGASAIYAIGVDRVFVFGGSSTTSEAPTNLDVYSLQLGSGVDIDKVYVTKATVGGAAADLPGPRSYGSLTYFKNALHHGGADHNRAMLFGGNTVGGTYSDTLTSMWIFSATNVFWERVTPNAGPRPSGRSHFGAAIDPNSQWLVISGGETAANTASAETWAFDLTCTWPGCTPTGHWERLEDLHLPVRANGAGVIGPEPAFPRLPEVFDPVGGHWEMLSKPHWQEWFSFGFTAPRGPSGDEVRVFYAGPEFPSATLHMSHAVPDWTALAGQGTQPTDAGSFHAGSAVMYRPGRIMKCGTRDTGGTLASEVFGRTAVIDLAAGTPHWTEADPADQMISRRNHNLIALPTGEVLVVGGARFGTNNDSHADNCVRMPQIWNPDTLTAGHWYGQETLPNRMGFDSSSVNRHYHASAILLPDARVLVAGGNEDTAQVLADIYSPYYLFNSSGGAAARPSIVSAPANVSYGERFVLCMSAADGSLSKLSLIKPAATTHGFDQNQRFMTLSFAATTALPSGEKRFVVTAPADSFAAPPGDYMLFALNASGTPSIARWIRVRRVNFDVDHPGKVEDLALVFNSYSSADQGVTIQWTPPYADSTPSDCRGPAAQYQIRYRYSGMSGWSEFAASTLAPSPPTPGLPWDGSQSYRLTGLPDGMDVHLRLTSKNSAQGGGNWSLLSNELVFSTPSSGGDEGGGDGDPILPHAVAGEASAMAPTDDAIVTSTFVENSLLTDAPPGVVQTDRLPLPGGPHWVGDHAQVKVSRWGSGSLLLKGVRLIAQDHANGDAYAVDGIPTAGTFTPAAAVRDGEDVDLAPGLAAGTPYESQNGDVLSVTPTAVTSVLMLRTSGGGPVGEGVSTGIGVQVPDQGGWREVASVGPRELESEAAVTVPTAASYRLVFRGNYRLHAVGSVTPTAGTPSAQAFDATAATHTTRGDVSAEIAQDGAVIAGGESIVAEFVPGASAPGYERDWFLEVTGVHFASGSHALGGGATSSRADALPTVWALRAPRPNPFAGSVELGFDVPRRGAVRIEVFDLLGRRVATPADATYEPGRYSVSWDRLGSSGSRVPPGMYTCRFTAGGTQEHRRMIVLP